MALYEHQPLSAFVNAIEELIGRDGMTGLKSEWKTDPVILKELREYGKVLINKVHTHPHEFMQFGSDDQGKNDLYDHTLTYNHGLDYFRDTQLRIRIIVNKAAMMKSDAAKSLFMAYCTEYQNGDAKCITGIETENIKWDVYNSNYDDHIQWILLYNEYAKEFDQFIHRDGIAFDPIVEIDHIGTSDDTLVNQYMLEYCMALEVYHQYTECLECFNQYAMKKILLHSVIDTE